MPIDPSIPLGVQPPQIQNPLASISAIAQLEDVRAQVEQRRQAADAVRQKAADEAAIRTVMAQSGGDFEQALPRLRQINPRAALAFATDLGKQREAEFKALNEKMTFATKQFEVGDRLLAYVHDDPSLQVVLPTIKSMSPTVATVLGDTYDPVKVQGAREMAKTAKERHDQEVEGLKLITDGKLVPGINTIFATADTPEKWAGFQDLGTKFGVPAAILDAIGPYSPENVARAKENAISPEKRAELEGQSATRAQTKAYQDAVIAGQAATRAQTAKHQTVEEQQGATRLELERQRLAKTAGGRPVTSGDARRVADFNSARDELSTLADTVSTTGATGAVAGFEAGYVPNWVTDLTGWGTDAKKKQAVIDRVKQVIGKTLEGGVLRKEDEIKYTRILPTISDPPDLVASKMIGLDAMIAQKRGDHLDSLADAGYDVSKFEARHTLPPLSDRAALTKGDAGTRPAPAAPARVGDRRVIKGQLAEWDGRGWKAVQ